MRNSVGLVVVLFCILCIIQENLVIADGDQELDKSKRPVVGHCGDGKSDPLDTKTRWTDACYDVDGNSYKTGDILMSCCGCFKFTCTNKTEEYKKDPNCDKKYGWVKEREETCCEDCHGKVFPAGSVMDVQIMKDRCATTVTTKCEIISGEKKATIEESLSYEKCCTNSSGIYLLKTSMLVPKNCSIRTCSRPWGRHEASWTLTNPKDVKGCDCCVYRGKLYPDKAVVIIKGQKATCCEGKWLVSIEEEEEINTTTGPFGEEGECFHEYSIINFHDLGHNHWGQDAVPIWIIEEDGRRLKETENTRPSVGITNLGDASRPVSFSGIVYSNSADKDVLGMVFGYHNKTNFYVVASAGTNNGPTNWYVGRLHATCGSECASTTTISDAIWRPSLHPEDITILASGTDHWRHPDIYRFKICFNPTEHLIDVIIFNESNSTTNLNTGTIYDSTANPEIEGGHIGVYVDSQANTVWDELNCADCKITMPRPTK